MPYFPAKKWWCQGGQVTTNKPPLIAVWVYSRRSVCGVCRLYLPDKKKTALVATCKNEFLQLHLVPAP